MLTATILMAVVALIFGFGLFHAAAADYRERGNPKDKKAAKWFFWLAVFFPFGIITIPLLLIYGVGFSIYFVGKAAAESQHYKLIFKDK